MVYRPLPDAVTAQVQVAEAVLRQQRKFVRGAPTPKTLDGVQAAARLHEGVAGSGYGVAAVPHLSKEALLATARMGLDDPVERARAAERHFASTASHRFAERLTAAHVYFQRQRAKSIESLKVPTLLETLVRPRAIAAAKVTGRERLSLLLKTLDSFHGVERTDVQREMHLMMIGAIALQLFRDDLEDNLAELLEEIGMKELNTTFMASMPRRAGKTYSVAMMAVAVALSIEATHQPIEQAIFSTGRRASQKLLELIYALLCKVPGAKEMIIKHNAETIWLQGPHGPHDVRKISCYPSKVKISARVVVVVAVARGTMNGNG